MLISRIGVVPSKNSNYRNQSLNSQLSTGYNKSNVVLKSAIIADKISFSGSRLSKFALKVIERAEKIAKRANDAFANPEKNGFVPTSLNHLDTDIKEFLIFRNSKLFEHFQKFPNGKLKYETFFKLDGTVNAHVKYKRNGNMKYAIFFDEGGNPTYLYEL